MLRWQQTFNVGYVPNNIVPKVFMTVALDLLDDPNHIHPRTKHDVGYRLSRSGLAIAYGQQIEFQGPIVENVTYSNDSQTIDINYTSVSSIELHNQNGLKICCEGSNCLNVVAADPWILLTILNKSSLLIRLIVPNTCIGKKLYGIRYLWRETPCPFKQASIYSSTDGNLPAGPYIKVF